jgi:hypothetical protein
MPGFMQGQSYDLLTAARLYTMGRNGIIGIPIDVVCSLLIGFMVFGIVLQATGGGKFFFALAQSLLGHTRGGAAKISILASGFFGMISGSTTSNTLTIGSMTIPAMKSTGFPAHYAAAIEACASTGAKSPQGRAFISLYSMCSFYVISGPYPARLLGLFVQVTAMPPAVKGLPEPLPPLEDLEGRLVLYLDILLLICCCFT